MKTINTSGLARRQLSFELRKRRKAELKKIKKAKIREQDKEKRKMPREYVLKIGEDKTDKKKTMTGLEARAENKLFLLRFGSGKEKRLKQWVWADEDRQPMYK